MSNVNSDENDSRNDIFSGLSDEMTSGSSMDSGNKMNKKILILACIIALLITVGGVFAFLNFKTTFIAGRQVCSSEGVPEDDYYEFRVFSDGETRDSYVEALTFAIRSDKAAKQWESDSSEITDMLSGYVQFMDDTMKLYGYTSDIEDKTFENLRDGFNNVQLGDDFKSLVGDKAGDIARLTAMLFSDDSYYLFVTKSDVEDARNLLNESLTNEVCNNVTVYKINPNEYDPDGIGLDYAFTEGDIQCIKDYVSDDSEYQYVAKSVKMNGAFNVSIITVANTDSYEVISINVSIGGDLQNYIAGFSLDLEGNWHDTTDKCIIPVVVDLTAAKEHVDKFADFIYDVFKPLTDEEALEEVYDFIYKEDEDVDDSEETGEESEEDTQSEEEGSVQDSAQSEEDIQKEYEDLKYSLLYEEKINLLDSDEFNNREDWGMSYVLDDMAHQISLIGAAYVDCEYLNRNFDELFAEASDEDRKSVLNEINTMISVFNTIQTTIKYSGDVEFVSSEIVEISEDELLSRQQSYKTEESKWYPNDDDLIEQIVYVTEVKYTVPMTLPEDCDIESNDDYFTNMSFQVATTDKGNRVIGLNIDFNDALDETLFDISIDSLEATPNYMLMHRKAEDAVDRSLYDSDDEYELALQKWLYSNYPQYYDNPVGISEYTYSSTASGRSSNSSGSVWKSIKKGAGEIWDWLSTDDQLTLVNGRSVLTLSGTLENIWDNMRDGNYGELPMLTVAWSQAIGEHVSEVADSVSDAVGSIKDSVSDWWSGLWR